MLDTDIAHRRETRSAGTIMLLLSLKLILLAFFILLTTMSTFEADRSRQVLESVAAKFVGKVPATEGLDTPDAALDALEGAESLVLQLKTLFRQTVPVVEVTESADGRLLRLEMPATSLFDPRSTAFATGRTAFLTRVADVLTGTDGGRRFRELRFAHAYPAAATVGEDALAVLRGGAFVRQLDRQGIAADKLSVGLWPVGADSPALGKIAIAIRLDPTPRPAERAADTADTGEARP
jgi:hypothetical protein